MEKAALQSWIKAQFDIEGERVFHKHPEFLVFRHTRNQKWFALYMKISPEKLGLAEDAISFPKDSLLEIVNVKVNPEEREILTSQTGVYPGYHMNKKYWISLDIHKVQEPLLKDLIQESYLRTLWRKWKYYVCLLF